MGLPDLIEIVPLKGPVRAEITVPGSKSITNRALILAAFADGEVTLEGALWSEDTQIMVDCLQKLGFEVIVKPDPAEFCNRTITVKGLGGRIPNAGTAEKPLELFVGNAGTAARFLSALVCLGKGAYRLQGVSRMHERPQAALFNALRELGYQIDSPNDALPAVIHGIGPRPGKCTVSIEQSSQFATALLLCAELGGWGVKVIGENAEESPYVIMARKLMDVFPNKGGYIQIEPDCSSGSYFLAASEIVENPDALEFSEQFGTEVRTRHLQPVRVANWPQSGWQIDQRFAEFATFRQIFSGLPKDWPADGFKNKQQIEEYLSHQTPTLMTRVSRTSDLGDSIMTAIVMAPLLAKIADILDWPIAFTDLGRLRLQETERVAALKTELTKCGVKVVEEGDTLTVYPSELHGAEIETYNDHRMAMCFAILGLKVPGIKLRNPACVKKTFPNFFQKLAAEPPAGLGATILDARTGTRLDHEDLFAD